MNWSMMVALLVALGACSKPNIVVTPANKSLRALDDTDPNTYTLNKSYGKGDGLSLSQMTCPQGMMEGANFNSFEVEESATGFNITMSDNNSFEEYVLAVLITTPDAILPKGPADQVENGRSFWVVESRVFPREVLGTSPFFYGVEPSNSKTVTALHGPFMGGRNDAYPWQDIEAGTCIKITLITNDDVNSIQANSYLLRKGDGLVCAPDEEIINGKCQKKVTCGPFESKINNKCIFTPSPEACQSLPGDLIFLEGDCRTRDYCGPDKTISGDRCVADPNSGIKGAHCRFEIFEINSCIDYRGEGWNKNKALKLCQGLNSSEMEAKLEAGPCEPKTYDTLCRVNMSNPGPYISEKEQIQGLSWGEAEQAYLFAVGMPNWVCDSAPFIIGKYTQKQKEAWPEEADWIPLDQNLELN